MPSKTLNINFLYLDLETCKRCKTTGTSLDIALEALSGTFELLGYSVTLTKVNITTKELAEQHRFVSSPTIRVNGIDICDTVKENNCKDCGDICGDNVNCRVFTYEGQEFEEPPAPLIADSILRILYNEPHKQIHPYTLPFNIKNFLVKKDSIVKRMSIYEPAMCCETGICGVGVDPELIRISTVLNTLKKKGVEVKRFNLSNAPMEFVNNTVINQYINEKGPEGLPAIMLDGEIVITGRYPSNEEFATLLGIPESYLNEKKAENKNGCCCSGDHC